MDTFEDVAAAKQILEGWKIRRKQWFKRKNGFFHLSNHWCDVWFWET